MLEGLWSVNFMSSRQSLGSGVVVFREGKLLGGDQGYFYRATTTLQGDTVTASLSVRKYQTLPGINNVMGIDNFDMTVTGKIDPQRMVLSGSLTNGVTLTVELTKRAEWP